MKILLLSDIHGNYPALLAVESFFKHDLFDAIVNCGDSTVYAPYPNECLLWLESNNSFSILGNTDRKVKKLLKGKTFAKPGKKEKRIMYTWTAEHLTKRSRKYLLSLKKEQSLQVEANSIGLFHGSPDHPNEFLFPSTNNSRFHELSRSCSHSIIITGHSHMPYHKIINKTHFINPGSVGRMFDGNPDASCATLHIEGNKISVCHYRIKWDSIPLINELKEQNLPQIYQTMFKRGEKLN